MRKDSAIQKKTGEIEVLAEEKRRQEKENGNFVEHMQLVHSLEIDQLKMENNKLETERSVEVEDLRVELELKESLTVTKNSTIASLETRCKQLTKEVEQQIANVNYTHNKLASKATKIVQLETEQADKNSIIAYKDSTIARKDSIIASKDTFLQMKEATNQSLNDQLTKTKNYLTSKPQVSSSTLNTVPLSAHI